MALPETIRYDKRGRIAYITINQPHALNSLLPEMTTGVEEAMADFNNDPNLTVAILTGTGEKAFCAGADLKATIPLITEKGLGATMPDPTRRFFSEVTKPIIAAVNGLCLAGGTEMLLGTDIRIAVEHATFGLTEPRWALMAGGGSHVRLPRQIAWVRAMEILLIGDQISAQDALQFNLINRVVPKELLMPTTQQIAERICENGPFAVQKIKEAAIKVYNMSWDEAFYTEYLLAAQVFASDDAKEGPKAFAEKRKPRF